MLLFSATNPAPIIPSRTPIEINYTTHKIKKKKIKDQCYLSPALFLHPFSSLSLLALLASVAESTSADLDLSTIS